MAVRVIVAEAEAAPPGRGAGPPAAGPQAWAARPARAPAPPGARARPTAVRPGGGRDRRTVAGRGGRSTPGAAASGGRDPAYERWRGLRPLGDGRLAIPAAGRSAVAEAVRQVVSVRAGPAPGRRGDPRRRLAPRGSLVRGGAGVGGPPGRLG
ncbi:MAG: hypothetical protein R2853_09825 [Thermomicrobiales bacterium]